MTDELERRLADATPAPPALDLDRLHATLRRRAADEGVLDVAWAPYDSPLGTLTLVVTPRGLLRISYSSEPIESQLQEVADRISPRIMGAPERTDAVRRELDAYFDGRLRRFATRVDWRLARGFTQSVLRATARVPFGAVSTYREVATAAGSPLAARAAGNALNANPVPIVVPCHRVLHSAGGLGGYAGGLERKRYLLELEGALPPHAADRRRSGT